MNKFVGWFIPGALVVVILSVTVVAAFAVQTKLGSNTEQAELSAARHALLVQFCNQQLQPVTEDCDSWADLFVSLYGALADDCLMYFDSDSFLVLMCMDNIVNGRKTE